MEQRLRAMREAILALADTWHGGADTVELDQARTGRLSRMDALQLQAMAKAGEARAQLELQRIEAALKRIETGTFGDCVDCGKPIAKARLEANPTVIRCVACAEAQERG